MSDGEDFSRKHFATRNKNHFQKEEKRHHRLLQNPVLCHDYNNEVFILGLLD